jgi:membrane protein DedA with SNARE-associated domain
VPHVLGVALATHWWAYVLLAVAVMASWAGVPFVGTAALGAAGVAVSQGTLAAAPVVVVATGAAEVGGLIGYAIGDRWGRALLGRPGKHQAGREQVMARGEAAYARWGRLAVFFTPAIVSGTARMRHGQFVVWNLVASFAWVVSVTASAYGLGRIFTGHDTARDVAILLIGVAVGVVIMISVHRRHRGRGAAPAA